LPANHCLLGRDLRDRFVQFRADAAERTLDVVNNGLLGSLAFMTFGSSYWGFCYLIGAVFLALAVMMTLWLGVAPLMFGVAWAASLTVLSLRLGRLAGNS